MTDNKETKSSLSAQETLVAVTREQQILKKELSLCIKQLETIEKGVNTTISDFHKDILVLRKIPESIKEEIKRCTPEIAEKIAQDTTGTYHDNLKKLNNGLSVLSGNISRITETCKEHVESISSHATSKFQTISDQADFINHNFNLNTSKNIKKFALYAFFITIICSIASFSSSYLLVKKIPREVYVESSNSKDIYVKNNSSVIIWDDKSKVKNDNKKRTK